MPHITPPKKRPRRPGLKLQSWHRCTTYFVDQWNETQLQHGRYPSARIVDTHGHCRSYMTCHWFGPDADQPKSEEEVFALIDLFMADVWHGKVRLKYRQSAWMCFTGYVKYERFFRP